MNVRARFRPSAQSRRYARAVLLGLGLRLRSRPIPLSDSPASMNPRIRAFRCLLGADWLCKSVDERGQCLLIRPLHTRRVRWRRMRVVWPDAYLNRGPPSRHHSRAKPSKPQLRRDQDSWRIHPRPRRPFARSSAARKSIKRAPQPDAHLPAQGRGGSWPPAIEKAATAALASAAPLGDARRPKGYRA